MAHNDLVVRGGLVVDGSGRAPTQADVAVTGDRIVAVGSVTGTAVTEIDGAGCIVTPGFVDIHTHYDGQVTWENTLAPSSDHGVTSVVMGNRGVGFAPARRDQHDLVVKLMEGVEDIPEVVMTTGVPWNWETFPEYLGALEQRQTDIDFAAQLPHSPLRVFVMGERGVSTEDAEVLALADGLRAAGTGVFQMVPNTNLPAADQFALLRNEDRPLVVEQVAARALEPLAFGVSHRPVKDLVPVALEQRVVDELERIGAGGAGARRDALVGRRVVVLGLGDGGAHYSATVVSGTVTYRDGVSTGALPGRLVRGARAQPA